VVVENDSHPSSAYQRAVARHADRLRVRHIVEPRLGIPFARNRALAEATAAGARYLAFIDDDEVPDAGWLYGLVTTQKATGAGVIAGPVLPAFPPEAPAWAAPSGLYDRARFPSGTRLGTARSGNVLLDLPAVLEVGRTFPEAVARGSGSDMEYFSGLYRDGVAIVWADDAIVHETVPASRLTMRYQFTRNASHANAVALAAVRDGGLRGWLSRAGAAAVQLLRGVALPVLGALSLRSRARAMASLGRAVGTLVGLAGRRLQFYRRVPST
jgi:succinoglycan biosynthesis protein ExoM